MAKRRRLVAPDKSELEKIDKSFAAKPPLGGSATAPIAQVAAESATLSGLTGVGDRVAMAKDTADAVKWRDLNGAGLAVQMVELGQIDAEYLRRDRVLDDPEAMNELKASIRANGLRSPIEVVVTGEGFGLVSGQRRLNAFLELAAQGDGFETIPAFIRDHDTSEAAYLSMVEENEVRANLTHYERGRIAVLATQQGVFESTGAAVNALFHTASKAKKSKIRSFALIHEALGDLLKHPTDLTEKLGLKIASALKSGDQENLRRSLDVANAQTAPEELRVLEQSLQSAGSQATAQKVGRPKEVEHLPPRVLQGGGTLLARVSNDRLVVEIRGRDVGLGDAEAVLEALEAYLE